MTDSTSFKQRLLYGVLCALILLLLSFSILPLIQAAPKPKTSSPVNPAFEQQVSGYEIVLEREPNNLTALRGLLEIRLQQGDLVAALPLLEHVAELNPEDLNAQLLVAQLRTQLADLPGALSAFQQVLTQQPDNLLALEGAVRILLAQGDPEQALVVLDATQVAAEADELGDESEIRSFRQMLRGFVYAEKGDDASAITIYDELIAAEPENYRPWLSKALTLRKLQDDGAAVVAFERAAELAPPEQKQRIENLALPILTMREDASGGIEESAETVTSPLDETASVMAETDESGDEKIPGRAEPLAPDSDDR
ncbi:MAG: tetratricopeptide repeat protein [Cyanobacteria bacterium P01_H01_bin.15]